MNYSFVSRVIDVAQPSEVDENTEHTQQFSQVSSATVSAYEVPLLEEEHNYFLDETRPKNVMSPKSAMTFAVNQLDIMKHDHDHLLEENCKLRKELKSLENQRFSFDLIKHSDSLVKFHTGMPSVEVFQFVFDQIHPKVADLCYYKGKKSFEDKSYQNEPYHKPGPSRVLRPVDEMLLVLMKLRLNLLHADLALRFKISNALVVSILSTWIPFLGFELKSFIRWPSLENIFGYYPNCFQCIKGLVLCIIDCTEFFTDNPSLAEANSKFYSNYKSHTTAKVLVGCGPSGCISFLSRIAGGAMSDKLIVQKSHLLDKIKQSASETDRNLVVLADRGFNISDILPDNVCFKYPPFKRGKTQFSVEEAQETKVVAHARIHVERVFGRIKEFRIFQTSLPLDFVDVIDHILTICCAIVNLNPEIIK